MSGTHKRVAAAGAGAVAKARRWLAHTETPWPSTMAVSATYQVVAASISPMSIGREHGSSRLRNVATPALQRFFS